MNARLRNFWCPCCREWLASLEVDRKRVHIECGTVAEWRDFPLSVVVAPSEEGARDASNELATA